MIEQFKKLLQETAEIEHETDCLSFNNALNAYKNTVENNLVYGRTKLCKYLILHFCIKLQTEQLNANDIEILKYYSNSNNTIFKYKTTDYKVLKDIKSIIESNDDVVKYVNVVNCIDAIFSNLFAKNSEWRKTASENRSNKKFYNNGKISVKAVECPEGFVKGRLKFKRNNNYEYITDEFRAKASKRTSQALIGKKWFNNGTVSIRAYECPEGYVPGRLNFNAHKNKCTV